MDDMGRSFLVAAALAATVLGAGSAQATLDPSAAPSAAAPLAAALATEQSAQRTLLAKAEAELVDSDFVQAAGDFGTLVHSTNFDLLGADERHRAYLGWGQAQLRAGDAKAAQGALRQASGFDKADQSDWMALMIASTSAHDQSEAITDLQTLARRWPSALSSLDDRFIGNLIDQTWYLPNGESRFVGLMLALEDANWRQQDKFGDPSDDWVSYARALISRGEIVHAQRIAGRVTAPWSLIRMQSDKDFDVVVHADPDRYDVKRALARELDRYTTLAHEQSDKLKGVNALGYVLMEQNRAADALPLFDEALAKIRASGVKPGPYSDVDDQKDWLLNIRAWTLIQLGRTDEGLKEMIKSAKPESGEPQISQVLNLAVVYDSLGRPRDALNILDDAPVSRASTFGVRVAEHARICALAQLNDQLALSKEMTQAKLRLAAVGVRLSASDYLCSNDLDAAAAEDMKSLESPVARSDFLRSVQEYAGSIFEVGPWANEIRRRQREVLALPKVNALLSKYGRVTHYNMLTH